MSVFRNRRHPLVGVIAAGLVSVLALASAPVFAQYCSVSSGTSWTGREWGWVQPDSTNPTVCWRYRVGGDAPRNIKSCHQMARDYYNCSDVRDAF